MQQKEDCEMPSKTYRVKSQYVPIIQKAHIDFIVETRLAIDEADIVNALIHKHIKSLTAKDVLKFKEETEEE
jgi:hypothetical protein